MIFSFLVVRIFPAFANEEVDQRQEEVDRIEAALANLRNIVREIERVAILYDQMINFV